jgi:5-hydroxyisourate hydrolase-like protein (transthyretin family)
LVPNPQEEERRKMAEELEALKESERVERAAAVALVEKQGAEKREAEVATLHGACEAMRVTSLEQLRAAHEEALKRAEEEHTQAMSAKEQKQAALVAHVLAKQASEGAAGLEAAVRSVRAEHTVAMKQMKAAQAGEAASQLTCALEALKQGYRADMAMKEAEREQQAKEYMEAMVQAQVRRCSKCNDSDLYHYRLLSDTLCTWILTTRCLYT